MAKKTVTKTKRMMDHHRIAVIGVAVVIVGLAASTAYFAHAFYNEKGRNHNFEQVVQSTTGKTPSGGQYNLGSLGIRIVNDKAMPRKDAVTDSIRAFLQKEADSAGCPDNNAVFSVTAYSADETQLLLGYGCDTTDGRMYAIKKDGAWQTVSPTNNFNELSVPSCQMVNDNGIHKDIAPVCYTLPDGDQGSVRYHYTLR